MRYAEKQPTDMAEEELVKPGFQASETILCQKKSKQSQAIQKPESWRCLLFSISNYNIYHLWHNWSPEQHKPLPLRKFICWTCFHNHVNIVGTNVLGKFFLSIKDSVGLVKYGADYTSFIDINSQYAYCAYIVNSYCEVWNNIDQTE